MPTSHCLFTALDLMAAGRRAPKERPKLGSHLSQILVGEKRFERPAILSPQLFLNLIARGYQPRRGIAVTRMRSPVPSDGLEPIEPDRVVGLVPLQDGPDPRLLVTRHDHFVDPLEADPDPLAVVLERLRDHRL